MKKSGTIFFKNLRYICLVGVIALGLMTIVGSGSNGSKDEQSSPTPTWEGTTELSETSTTFNISDAKALLAQEETVTASSVRKTSSDGRSLFTYNVVNQGLERPLTKEESLERAKSRSALAEDDAGTNLLAVDEDGNAWLAIESDYFIKVMYSVTDPEGEYVYLALDTGWGEGWDGNDYTRFIAQENCAFFRVKIADNTCDCVKEGIFVQKMDEMYMQAISGDQKPIQFDDDGNVYFSGTAFTRQENSWDECWWDEGAQTEVCTTRTDYWIQDTSWNPLLYRLDHETAAITDITPDNTSVNVFIVLPTGEIAYQAYNIDTWTGGGLYMWQDGATIPLSDATWGVNFFTGDTKNAVMWGAWEDPGVRFARPRTAGGAEKATLDTRLFGGNFGTGNCSTPLRIIVADDGRLYGVFESWQSEYDSDTTNWTYSSVLSVFQMLPYDGIPKVELTLDDSAGGWWGWMENTPFKISKGYLYYTESENVEFYGDRDVIRMVKLEDRSINTILDSETQRYEIYSWNLSGNTLYFSALELSTTTVVTGEIDTLLVKQGSLESAYLSVTETASALGASSAVQDIEVLTPQAPATDTGSAPVVEKFHVSQDNIYSASIDFTKYMNKSSVETYLTFTDDTDSTSVDSMNIWIHKALHLIPDLSGLGDAVTTPLAPGTYYTIALGSGTMDNFGWDLAAGTQTKSVTFETKPDYGWYSSTTDEASGDLSLLGVAKYAGPATDWTKETFALYADGTTDPVDASDNVRIEFSAKNYGWDGIDVVLWNNTHYDSEHTGDTWVGFDATVRMGGWTSIDYKTGEWDDWSSNWTDGNTPDLFNGSWARYRIDFYGTNLVVSYSEGGTTFTEAMSVTDFRTRVGNTDDLTFLIRAVNPVVVDNLQVSALDSSGELLSTAGNILDLDFTSSIDPDFGTADVGETYGLDGWW